MDYLEIRKNILHLQRPTFRETNGIYGMLSAFLLISAGTYGASKKVYREKLPELLEFWSGVDIRGLHSKKYSAEVSEKIGQFVNYNLFPLEEALLDTGDFNFSDDFRLYIETFHYQLLWDDFNEMVGTDPVDLRDRDGIYMFFGYIWGSIYLEQDGPTEEDYWRLWNERFRWNIPEPPKISNNVYIAENLFRKKLKKYGLQDVVLLMNAIAGDTGNIFIDFNPETWTMPEIEIDMIVNLYKEWKRVQSISHKCDEIWNHLTRYPGKFKIILEAYMASLKPRKKKDD